MAWALRFAFIPADECTRSTTTENPGIFRKVCCRCTLGWATRKPSSKSKSTGPQDGSKSSQRGCMRTALLKLPNPNKPRLRGWRCKFDCVLDRFTFHNRIDGIGSHVVQDFRIAIWPSNFHCVHHRVGSEPEM